MEQNLVEQAPALPALLAQLFAAQEKRLTTPTSQCVGPVLGPVTMTEADCEEVRGKTASGESKTKQYQQTYQCWQDMKRRCLNEKSKIYKHYGGRGIQVCARWIDSFENFRNDMGLKPNGLSIERKDNDGNYEPSNCVWADAKTQLRNRRTTRIIEFQGERLTTAEWSARLGISTRTIAGRLRRGMPPEHALSPGVWTPVARAAALAFPKSPHLRKCRFCKAWDHPENLTKEKNIDRHYHRACAAQQERERATTNLAEDQSRPALETEQDRIDSDLAIHRWKQSGGPVREHDARAVAIELGSRRFT